NVLSTHYQILIVKSRSPICRYPCFRAVVLEHQGNAPFPREDDTGIVCNRHSLIDKGIVHGGGQSTGLVKETVLKSKQVRLVRDAVSCQWLHRIKLNVWVYHARGLGRKKVHWVPLSCQFIDDACRMANHPASLDARRHVSAQEKNT